MTFPVDKNVPLPIRRGRGTRETWTRWNFNELEVGDSLFVPGVVKGKTALTASQDYAAAHPPVKFTSQATDDDSIYHQPGVRFWRTE